MASGRPLFPGFTVEDELRLIIKGLGTPPADAWPDLTMPYTIPQYVPDHINTRTNKLDSDGLDLLNKFLCVSYTA